jgi:hypothetical protein
MFVHVKHDLGDFKGVFLFVFCMHLLCILFGFKRGGSYHFSRKGTIQKRF